MRVAEEITFGTSSLDRAGGLRRDGARLARALAEGAPVLPMWRGKPMAVPAAAGDGAGMALAFRRIGDAVLVEAGGGNGAGPGAAEAVLLGMAEDGASPVFALDVSAWTPEALDAAEITAFRDPSVQVHPSERASGAGFHELRGMMTALSRRDAELAATARAVLGWHATHRFCSACGAASLAAEAGWHRHCPACDTRHFPRTDPVVIMLITHADRVLLGRSPGWPPGMYSLLAGFVEPGETVEAAVRREVFEEAGIRVGRVDYLSSQPWPFPMSLMLGCHGRALDTAITRDPEEIEDARWLSRSELLEVFAGNRPGMLPARKGAIAHFLLQHWLSDRLD